MHHVLTNTTSSIFIFGMGLKGKVAQILTITIFLYDWKRDWSHIKYTLDGALVFLAE